MWRDAVAEVRQHPGKFMATFFAIAISVSFIVAITTMVRTEVHAFIMNSTLPVSKSDILVSAYGDDDATLRQELEALPGVRAVAPVPETQSRLLARGDSSAPVMLVDRPAEGFEWATIVEGRYPDGPGELTVSKSVADSLDADVGDEVSIDGDPYTVVGMSDDSRSILASVAYAALPQGRYSSQLQLQVDDVDAVIADVERVVGQHGPYGMTTATAEHRQEQVDRATAGALAIQVLSYSFAGVALIIGTIIIANTFTILATQRRRQVALLRAVGASPGQIVGRLLLEGAIVGAIGSAGGILFGLLVAAVGGLVTGALAHGLQMSVSDWIWPFVVGVLITVIAATGPSIKAATVRPLEALQQVPTPRQARRASALRLVTTVLLGLLGVACFVASRAGDFAVVWGVATVGALSFALLIAAPYYVAPLLRLGRAIFGRIGPTVHLAFDNAARNPRRAAATAVALILAVGITVLLQSVLATFRETGRYILEQQYPVDVEVFASEGIPNGLVDELRGVSAVRAVSEVPSKHLAEPVNMEWYEIRSVVAFEQVRRELDVSLIITPEEGKFLGGDGGALDLPTTDGGALRLKRQSSQAAPVQYDQILVHADDYARIAGEERVQVVWLRMVDRSSNTQLGQITRVLDQYDGIEVTAQGAESAFMLETVLDIAMVILTVMLGVAVLIALVGVGNTLGLSVLERQRESALLRAVGMQPGSLRLMLLIEAMALMVVGVGVGAVGGMGFAWIGYSSVTATVTDAFGPDAGAQTRFAVDVGATTILILVCAVAAALASILPGRKAASAAPAEALAIE